MFAAGQREAAIERLAAFQPPQTTVGEVLSQLRVEAAAIARREQEQANLQAADALVERGRQHLASARLAEARAASQEALQLVVEHEGAQALAAAAAIAIEQERVKDEHDRAAAAVVEASEAEFQSGAHRTALDALRRFSPPHAAVALALTRLEAELVDIERREREAHEQSLAEQRAREEAARREREEAERLAKEAARRARVEAERRAREEKDRLAREADERARAEAEQKAREEMLAQQTRLAGSLDLAQRALDAAAFDAAIRHANTILDEEAAHPEATVIRDRAVEGLAERERQKQQEKARTREEARRREQEEAKRAAALAVRMEPPAETVAQQPPTAVPAEPPSGVSVRTRVLAVAAGVVLVAALGFGAFKMLTPATGGPVIAPSARTGAPGTEPAGRGQQVDVMTAPPITDRPAADVPVATFPVTIDAVPWADVQISPSQPAPGVEDQNGTTPMRVNLPAGKYTVRFSNPSAQRPVVQTLTVAPDRNNVVRVNIPGLDAERILQEILPK